MGGSEKELSQQEWFCSREIHRIEQTFLATSPSQTYSTTFIISSSCLQQPCSCEHEQVVSHTVSTVCTPLATERAPSSTTEM